MEHIRSLRTGIIAEYQVMSTSQGTYGRIEQTSHLKRDTYEMCKGGGVDWGLELGTADVAYCSNVVSGILVCECMCVQGAWLWTVIAGRVGRSLSVLSG